MVTWFQHEFEIAAESVPVVFYENSRAMVEQIFEGAFGTVLIQIVVDVMDVLNSRREIRPFQSIVRLPQFLFICWLDAPLLQVVYHSLH